jgi:hypothetical protein
MNDNNNLLMEEPDVVYQVIKKPKNEKVIYLDVAGEKKLNDDEKKKLAGCLLVMILFGAFGLVMVVLIVIWKIIRKITT